MSALRAVGNYRNFTIDKNTTPEELDMILKNCPSYKLKNAESLGTNALHLASYYRNLELVRHIIKIAGNELINHGDFFGRTPLSCVIKWCKSSEKTILIVKELIRHGADVNIAICLTVQGDPDGATPLWIAAGKRDNIKLVKLLLKNGAEVNPTSLSTERQEILEEAKEEIEQEKETFIEFLACRRKLEKNDPRYDMVPREILLQIYKKYNDID